MTDDDVLAHAPTAAALICAVHDRDPEAVDEILTPMRTTGLHALVVLLAALVPDDRSIRELLAEDGTIRTSTGVPVHRDDWTDAELRDAHAAWNRRIDTPWSRSGEREYQRRRQIRRRKRKAGTEGIDTPTEGRAA